MPQAELIGVDLTSSPTRPSAVVGLDKQLKLIFADFNHDLCDAAIAVYTAYLSSGEEAEPIGDIADGYI